MDIKELVYKIQTIDGVSVHVPDDNIISIGNASGFNPRLNVSEIASITEGEGPNGEPAIQLSFVKGQTLFITERDFAFTVVQKGKVVVNDFPIVVTISEAMRDVNSFSEAVRDPNLDAVEAAFYQIYYMLDSAAYYRFDIDTAISRFYDYAKDLYFFERENFPLFSRIYTGNRGLELKKLKVENCYGILDFIYFWRDYYAYGNEEKYNRIFNPELEKEDLIALYEWKNGMDNLSGKKQESLEEKILSKIDLINKLRHSEKVDINQFLEEFKSVSAVWKIFLLHIIKPFVFPIYDQHVHRTYMFINGRDFSDINSTMNDSKKLSFYFDEYLPFINRMEITNLKEMDEAFFAFGQFLNTNNQKQLLKD